MQERYYEIYQDDLTYHLPSVTSILAIHNKPGLNEWRAKQGYELSEQYSQETADIGKEIHRYVAQLLQGTPISKLEWGTLSEEIKNGLRAFSRFKTETNLKADWCERVVYNLKLGYAGTLDCLGKIDGRWVVIDWKTGNTFWPSYFAQITAYYKALNINRSRMQLYAVNLNRNTGIPIVNKLSVKDCTPYWNYFKSCLSLFNNAKTIEALERR